MSRRDNVLVIVFIIAFIAFGISGIDPLGPAVVIGIPLLLLYSLVRFVKWAWQR